LKSKTIEIEEALRLDKCIFIDVRSPGEYNDNRIMNARNLPLLDDEERKIVGTLYKNAGKENAVEMGLELVSPKLSEYYKQFADIANEYDNVVVYCSRGGMRSKSVVELMNSTGMSVMQLKGGYKAYRNYVIEYLSSAAQRNKFIVLHGLTGVGKTEVLKLLQEEGLCVLDLEELAKNCGSVFGHICYVEDPPSQKLFETAIFDVLYNASDKYIFTESESKRVGSVMLPNEIYEMIVSHESLHILLEASPADRTKRLVDQYVRLSLKDDDKLMEAIGHLRKRMGNEKVDFLLECIEAKDYSSAVEKLIEEYYDPMYNYSIDKYKYDAFINTNDIDSALRSLRDFRAALSNS